MGELLIYKASAGSGKTFTLAVEYIKHLILYSRAYRRILAVTFTNKATAEMKERILGQLYGIWTGDKDSDAYLRRIIEDTKLTEKEIRSSAGQALANILHDYSYFRVETIDSFFQSVMRNLARELELSPNLNIELNQEEVLSEAVDSMIEKLRPNSPVLIWLSDYINERIANDKRWNVSGEIKKFARNIFNEEYIEKGAGLRQRLKTPHAIRQYRKKLDTLMKEAQEEMERYAVNFEKELETNGLNPGDLKNGIKGIGSYFKKIKEGELSTKKTRNATLEKCLADKEEWASKTSPKRLEIVSLAASRLIELLEETENARQKNTVIVNSCRLSVQHLNKLQLLASIDEEVRELNKEKNRFLLSDTNALLHNLIKDEDSSFVFEKIGSGIRNVMIDEFQDTSRMQWGNFKLLLIEGLSQGADSLIVGDVKQSIYRWRSGDWGILNGLNDKIGHFPVTVKTLTVNRRSETNIIQFNNDFFAEAVNYLNNKHNAELGIDCKPLQKAYQDVIQESPRTDGNGYAKVSFIEQDDDLDYTGQTLKLLGEEVARLSESGVGLNDMAILVRKNKNIPIIAEYFDREIKCKIVSDEAFRLDASPAVRMMIDALRLLSNPGDAIAGARLIIAYQNEVLNNGYDLNTLLLHPDPYLLPERFVSARTELLLMPLYELLEELFVIFQMELIKDQDAYLFAFYDAVMNYLQNNPADLDSFIRHWEDKLCGKTIPGGEIDGIRIFSIHKSKGLEFHTVLIPFCDWKLENETNDQLVWCIPQIAPYNEIDIVPVSYNMNMAESVFRNDYLHERLQLWVDNLNLLYVAFTRAEKNLIVWSKKKQRGTVAELLANALPSTPFETGVICPSEYEKPKETTNRLIRKPEKWPAKMESVRHNIKFRQSNRSSDFIKGISEEKSRFRFIDRGQLLHTLFSGIQTVQDIDAAIGKLVFEGIIGSKEQEDEILSITGKAFSLPQVTDWYSGNWKLFNERAIIYNENGVLQTRRPDRVMMKDGRMVVVDLKFGKPQGKHKKQIRVYRELLTEMGYDNVEGYLWYVDEEVIERVEY